MGFLVFDRSRLPSVHVPDDPSVPVLSPRTPGTAASGDIDFPQFPPDPGNNMSIRNALDALDSYANSAFNYGQGFNTDVNYGMWGDYGGGASPGFDFTTNPPPPQTTTPGSSSFMDGALNPFSNLPGLSNQAAFGIPTSTQSVTTSDTSPAYTVCSASSVLKPGSPRGSNLSNQTSVFSEHSYSSPNRLSSVDSLTSPGVNSPFGALPGVPPEFPLPPPQGADFSMPPPPQQAPPSGSRGPTPGQTPSRQSSASSTGMLSVA